MKLFEKENEDKDHISEKVTGNISCYLMPPALAREVFTS